MLLPLMAFPLVLIVVGGLASLVAVGDPRHARLAPFIGFTSLLAGVGALLLSMVLGGVGHAVDEPLGTGMLSGIGFLFGYVAGGVGGAVWGVVLASRRARRRARREMDS